MKYPVAHPTSRTVLLCPIILEREGMRVVLRIGIDGQVVREIHLTSSLAEVSVSAWLDETQGVPRMGQPRHSTRHRAAPRCKATGAT